MKRLGSVNQVWCLTRGLRRLVAAGVTESGKSVRFIYPGERFSNVVGFSDARLMKMYTVCDQYPSSSC